MSDNTRWEQQFIEVGDAIEEVATNGQPGVGKFDRFYETVREWHCLFEDRARLMQVIHRPHVQVALLALYREVLKAPKSFTEEAEIATLPACAALNEFEIQDLADYREQVDLDVMRAAVALAASKAAS